MRIWPIRTANRLNRGDFTGSPPLSSSRQQLSEEEKPIKRISIIKKSIANAILCAWYMRWDSPGASFILICRPLLRKMGGVNRLVFIALCCLGFMMQFFTPQRYKEFFRTKHVSQKKVSRDVYGHAEKDKVWQWQCDSPKTATPLFGLQDRVWRCKRRLKEVKIVLYLYI